MPPIGIWTIASVVCLIAAAVFLVRDNYDAAFVLAALGAVSWFLNYRSQIREKVEEETGETADERDDFDDEDKE